MKSYSHLWEKLIDPETIKLAIRKSARRKKDRPRVRYIYNHQDDFIEYYTLYASGYIKSTNTYDMYKENIKPFVNFGDCKNYISFYDRRKIA